MMKMIGTVAYENLDEWFDEHSEDFMDKIDKDIAFDDADENGESYGRILADTLVVRIPELNLAMREGVYEVYEEEDDDYMADWSLTLIYENDGEDVSSFAYYEQDSMTIALHNYSTICGLSINPSATCNIYLEV